MPRRGERDVHRSPVLLTQATHACVGGPRLRKERRLERPTDSGEGTVAPLIRGRPRRRHCAQTVSVLARLASSVVIVVHLRVPHPQHVAALTAVVLAAWSRQATACSAMQQGKLFLPVCFTEQHVPQRRERNRNEMSVGCIPRHNPCGGTHGTVAQVPVRQRRVSPSKQQFPQHSGARVQGC